MSDAPSWLERLSDGTLDEVSSAEVDTLEVTSGRIVACDPLVYLRGGADAFAREVPNGQHAVHLGQMDGDNAFAMVRFAKGAPVTWEVARCPGEEDAEGWPGYGVDSGIGSFVDAAAVRAFVEHEDEVGERVTAKLLEEGVDPSDPLGWHEADHEAREAESPDPLNDLERALSKLPVASVALAEGGPKLVAFRAGAGDGVYASFWGLSEKGAPLCLVTDFGIVEPPDDDDDEDDDFDDGDLDELAELANAMRGSELSGLEALAAALAGPAEPEETQGPSPLFLQARDLLKRWVSEEKIELEPDTNVDAFAEALLEKLVSLAGHRHPGAHVGEWLLDRPEVADVFASDDEIEADLTPK